MKIGIPKLLLSAIKNGFPSCLSNAQEMFITAEKMDGTSIR
jgi:hypothetical protein